MSLLKQIFARKFWENKWPPLVAAVAIIVLWDLVVRIFRFEWYIFPSPWMVVKSLYSGLIGTVIEQGDFLYLGAFYIHMAYTITEIVVGWIIGSIIGFLIAVAIFQFKFIERSLLPWINASTALPKIALIPLFLIWFGLGMSSKIALVIFSAFFPVMLNTLLGFRTVEPERIDLMKSLGASRGRIYRSVIVPSALPSIFAGLEMALLFSFLAAVAGEFVASARGLGLLAVARGQTLDMPGVFAVIVIAGVLGWLADTGFRRLVDKICFWAVKEQG